MTDRLSAADPPPGDRAGSACRLTIELVGWIAAPWALGSSSPLLGLSAVVVLIGLASVFGTAGDRGQPKPPLVAVPGYVTVALVLVQFAAALIASWYLQPWFGFVVLWLVLIGVAAELPRWRWLLRH